ncbi:MAG TPA: hypothetical protein VG269_24830 [Tepidisphaeraceae bacterium]|nr:hypothetical protein [Tepidisphaeraceae bacterium]
MAKDQQPLDYQTAQPKRRIPWAIVLATWAAVFLGVVIFGAMAFRVVLRPAVAPSLRTIPATVTSSSSSYYAPTATQPATRKE